MTLQQELQSLVDSLLIADTHEHLLEEASRLQPGDGWRLDDIGLLFSHYGDNDLQSAGMPPADIQRLLRRDTPPDQKWALLRPWWPLIQHTGYGQAITESIRLLWQIDQLDDATWSNVNDRIRQGIKPGYYRHILRDIARIDHAQVNSLEAVPFCETAQPDLLLQDLSFLHLSSAPDIAAMERLAGSPIRSLDDFLAAIDACFARFGPRAIAIKNQGAYRRRLDHQPASRADAERSFARLLAGGRALTPDDTRPHEDFLFHYCIARAREFHLPVKLHSGFYAGAGHMPLHRVSTNPGDLCDLLVQHPDVTFIIMHTIYPYQDEAIAIAKHHPNAVIDMCWSWIINPTACVRFLKEAVKAAPLNKLLCFGGDYAPVELVPGHAAIARRGVVQALAELSAEGWIPPNAAPGIAQRLLRDNALAHFDVARARSAGSR